MPKINIEDYLEENLQARKFYGIMSLDKMCTYCEGVLTFEQYSLPGPCQLCGEWAGLIDKEE